MSTLQIIWFILIFVLLAGYAVLDGFDLGVGMLHLLARTDRDRRIALNAIGPVWDGNEVWLLTAGGALFAAFPPVYATVFSGLYLALMLLLAALIARAVAIEFRSKVESPAWRSFWDVAFAIGSLLPALLLGVAFGNILRGLPLTADREYAGSFFTLLNPFSLLVGLTTVAGFALHGCLYLAPKASGEFAERLEALRPRLFGAFALLWVVTTALAPVLSHDTFMAAVRSPGAAILLPLTLASLATLWLAIRKNRPGQAFAASALCIITMIALGAVGLFPRLVPGLGNDGYSLTIHNSSSTQRTLATMLVIAGIGMPLVLAYTAIIYRVFRGQVVLTEESY